jgi:hypothetical protein
MEKRSEEQNNNNNNNRDNWQDHFSQGIQVGQLDTP